MGILDKAGAFIDDKKQAADCAALRDQHN